MNEPSSHRRQGFLALYRPQDVDLHASVGARTLVVTIDDFSTTKVDGRNLLLVDDARALLCETDHANLPIDAVNRFYYPDHDHDASVGNAYGGLGS